MQVEADISIPFRWTQTYPNIFAYRQSVHVARTQAVKLTEVVLVALSEEAYRFAMATSSPLTAWLQNSERILRQSETHTFTPQSLPPNGHVLNGIYQTHYRYRLDMTSPVMQGIATENTQFIIVRADNADDDSVSASSQASSEFDFQEDGLEIDASFLAGSVLEATESEIDSDHDGYFQAQALDSPIDSEIERESLYIRTSDLGRVGSMNGDWVSASIME